MSRDYNHKSGSANEKIDFLLTLFTWKNNDLIDLFDPEQVRRRSTEFFALCREWDKRPTLSTFSAALNINRQRLYEIVSGNHYKNSRYRNLPAETVQIIRDGYALIQAVVEDMLVTGEINPVSGIFLAKNMGIKDTNDYFENEPEKESADIAQLKEQYLNQLPGPKGE